MMDNFSQILQWLPKGDALPSSSYSGMGVQLRFEELREAELEMEVSICEPEQGEVLGE